MDLISAARIFKERWLVLAVAAALGLAVGFSIFLLSPRSYESSATIYVSSRTPTDNSTQAYQGGLLSEQRVKSYVQLVTGQRIRDQVAVGLNGRLNADQLSSVLTATSQPDTVLIQISAQSSDPQLSADVANLTGTSFTALVSELERTPGPGEQPAVTAQVVEPAVVNSTQVSPRLSINLVVGAILGLLAGCVTVLIWNLADSRLRSREDLERAVNAPILGSVAMAIDKDAEPALQVRVDPFGAVAESIREIRTNLQYIQVDSPKSVLLVTSAVQGEGKSTTVSNLALSLADAGVRVLVVEADLRRPQLAKYMGLDDAVGLSTVLAGRVSATEAVQMWGTTGVRVMTSGPLPPNPSELLGSSQLQKVLLSLSGQFDLVLIDGAPVLPVSDSVVLSRVCDGVLLVSRADRTAAHEATAAADAIRKVGSNLLGCVLSMVAVDRSQYSKYYRYESLASDFKPRRQRTSSEQDGSETTELDRRPSPGPRR